VTTSVNVGAVLVQATGSEGHLAELAAHASSRGYSLTGAALWHDSEFVATTDEESLYRAVGLPLIPPELREGRGEVAAAARGELPRLLERADLKGFLHCHTTYSDGSTTIEQLAVACREAGYQYVGITDHSQAAAYAGGLQSEDLLRQADEIDDVNSRVQGIRVLKGVEADILADGRVDFEEYALARLDFVIASIHSRFNMGPAEMTARMLTAMDNPYLTIIGHPTGRLLLSRDPYGLDLDAVIEKAAAKGVALEINADPHRLDLDWRVLRQVRAGGVMVSIGADAHSLPGLGYVDFGVGMARKGWLGPDDILNARPVENFLAFARRRQ
jgi:DNA polymerase (family 10)